MTYEEDAYTPCQIPADEEEFWKAAYLAAATAVSLREKQLENPIDAGYALAAFCTDFADASVAKLYENRNTSIRIREERAQEKGGGNIQ